LRDDLKYWVALSTNLNIGARTFQKLYAAFSDMEKVWNAGEAELRQKGLDPKIIANVRQVKASKNPSEELEKIYKLNIHAITYLDTEYPALLKEIPDCPALLYLKGKLLPADNLSLAVVGSRRFTDYGARVVKQIVEPLANAGLAIVSGLALGIDALSHRAALNCKGRTIAVLGNGLDHIYPESNRNLANQIIYSGGAVLSEFPVGTPSFKQNFPFRNRIIAGMSLGTLVIEAALESGSLITARAALDYNRDVFAIPGEIFSNNSEGPNNLIKMGAKTVTEADDVLKELNIDVMAKQNYVKEIIPDTKEEAQLLAILSKVPVHIDKLVEISKLDIVKINQTLTMMEMKGKVRNLGGNQYIINQ